MAARSTVNRDAIAQSYAMADRGTGAVLEYYRPPIEAMDDLDWFANEAPAEMGHGSDFGGILFRASLEREWLPPDQRDKELHRAGLGDGAGHYGKPFASGPWEEWVGDVSYRKGGYFRPIWGQRVHASPATAIDDMPDRQIVANEMYRNIDEVLARMPPRLRAIAIAAHYPRVHGQKMREVFGKDVVSIAHLSLEGRARFEAARKEGTALDITLYAWLEGVAIRVSGNRPRAGEVAVVAAVKKEMKRDLKAAYATFEIARDQLPRGRRYPHRSSKRRAQRMSLVGR